MAQVHISLDLETWGKRPGCDLRSIGAAVFDPMTGYIADLSHHAGDHCPAFYIATDNPCKYPNGGDEYHNLVRKYLLTRDPSTVSWWNDQSAEAQAAFADPVDLREALQRFAGWLHIVAGREAYSPSPEYVPLQRICIWSHGAAFDPPILAAAYEAVGLPVPWHYRAPRDTRTAFDMADVGDHSTYMQQFNHGTAHHALDDAISQARAVCGAFERVRDMLNDCHASR